MQKKIAIFNILTLFKKPFEKGAAKMKRGKVVFGVAVMLFSVYVLIILAKPIVYIQMGTYTAASVFGEHVAKSKKMATWDYSFKVTIVNVYNFSATKYKERNPTDTTMGSDRSATILTNDPAHIYHELFQIMKMNWFRMTLEDRAGKITILHNEKYLGI